MDFVLTHNRCLYHDFIEAIETYSRNRSNDVPFSTVRNLGLKVFLRFPSAKISSLFSLNEETFEFVHTETVPLEYEDESLKYFQILVDSGDIGTALSTKAVVVNTTHQNGRLLTIPLLKPNAILGLVILYLDDEPVDFCSENISLCMLQANLFSYSLDYVLLTQNKYLSESIMDQKVAYLTLDLVKSKKQLAQQFENLQSNISMALPHEFRTPINQILGSANFLAKHYTLLEPDEVKETILDIASSAERLKRITDNYVFYSKLNLISSNIYEIEALHTAVLESPASIISEISENYGMNHERFDDFILDLEDTAIAIAGEYFDKLIREVIDNSIKYSEKGTRILIQSVKTDDMLDISIKDFGRGMSQEQIDMLGAAYLQFDRTKYEQQGLGLGLSIAMKIAYLHNGDFKVESELDKFTHISIQIPIAKNLLN
ncbi:MAG: two-component system, sensor histidine kinase and response regulator [Bacteroidota bacterium]|nr:two-component system, sensor histidine kinase and response regulator [Bacteroidota bacterium]